MNDKAINFIHCALNEHDYMKISTCETAKEIWDKLQITYEDETDSDDDEVANLCLMASEEKSVRIPKKYTKYSRQILEKESLSGVVHQLPTAFQAYPHHHQIT
ncbi:hypothetical protein Ahy_B02g059691 [Arachis hypogaea]|uniref:Uncharacterized protein n=1 Tax=Arachis hypogaea TaxID=3818 RepID=A0A445AGZ7_ARAHY|nr:hypothetical protein Ahy_B02g059691 [Arachis hypogaea]